MENKVLYLGDTAIDQQAAYLAGVMTHFGIGFDYLDSGTGFDSSLLDRGYKAVIISDYPAQNFPGEQLDLLAAAVGKGMGLLMIGGWESFTGMNHEYTDTVLGEVLPVVMSEADDRVNCYSPCLIDKQAEHAIVAGLPFDTEVPHIGGYNRFGVKDGAEVILCSQRFRARKENGGFVFEPVEEKDPLLVTGSYGEARTAALATDAAPHWVGGFVDWGDARVKACASGAEAIEVGNWYARFFANLVKWVMREI